MHACTRPQARLERHKPYSFPHIALSMEHALQSINIYSLGSQATLAVRSNLETACLASEMSSMSCSSSNTWDGPPCAMEKMAAIPVASLHMYTTAALLGGAESARPVPNQSLHQEQRLCSKPPQRW